MGKAQRPGSKSRCGQKSRSKRDGQTHNPSDDHKIARSKSGPANIPDPDVCNPLESEMLTPKQAARFINMSESFLAKARMTGDGPRYLKLGRAVRYRKSDLVAWLKISAKTSTAE